ncbi:MAG: hypothetical protein E3J86_01745 [Candidatus Thorarchaeota archaeon]|nr:MAG: hypothetical protein E3J86_01745 [Candidatus Thorarchaeota archaeon]
MGFVRIDEVRVKHVIVFLSLSLLIVAPLVSSNQRVTEPNVVVEEYQMEGSTGYTVSKTSCSPQSEVVVYNGTVKDPGADWYSESFHSEIHTGITSVNVELSGTVPISNKISHISWAKFYGNPTLPLLNYSEVTVSVPLKSLRGSANITVYVYPKAWPDTEYRDYWEIATHLEEGNSETLVLNPSINRTYNLSSGWIVRSNILVDIISTEESLIQIGEVVISARSTEDLYPVTFDFQSPDGESLLLNPYMYTLRETDTHTVNGELACYPALELTRTGNITESSIFVQRTFNETLYLAAGQYEGVAGWFTMSEGISGWPHMSLHDSTFNVSFVVEPGDSILVEIRVTAYRLSIDLSPSFAYSVVWIIADEARYNGLFPLQETEYLFIPGSEVYLITLGASFLTSTYIFVETEGSTSVKVSITYPHLSFFGMILDWGQMIGLVGALLLLSVFVYEGIKNNFVGMRKHCNHRISFLPISLSFMTLILPWVNYTYERTFTNPAFTAFATIMVPIFTTFFWNPTSQVTPISSSNPFPNAIPIIFLYWIPIVYLSYLIITSRNCISHDLSRNDMHPLLRIAVIGGPFIIGCYYLWLCILGLYFIDIGLVAALLSLPSWVIVLRLEKRNNQIQSANDNSQSPINP